MSTKSAEETIRGLIQAAKENAPEHQTVDGIESWKITMDGEVYKVSVADRKAKTGRAFNCHGLVKILPDGTEETVNLGAWKKKLFYTLAYNLQQGKVFKKNEQNPGKVKAIVKDMKENPANYTKSEDLIQGTFNGKPITVSRTKKTYKSGKSMYRITMSECGIVTLKGSQLQPLFKA